MNKPLKNIAVKALRAAHASPLGGVMNDVVRECGGFDLSWLDNMGWEQLDPIFKYCRRRLFADPNWRFGPKRVHEVAGEAFRALSMFHEIKNARYADMGCGHHPFGTSSIFYLNGAASCTGLDLRRSRDAEAAQALFDLLVDCLVAPEDWRWGDISRDAFLKKLQDFDLSALREGHLEKGLNRASLEYKVSDITKNTLPDNAFDVMSSRAVLEHFLDFDQAVTELYRIMAPGGHAYHAIDLVDHRWYDHPETYHMWSFLAEPPEWTDGVCNRLRAGQFKEKFEQAGFKVVRFDRIREPLPAGVRDKVAPPYHGMSDEELETTGVHIVVHKPA